MWRQTALAFVLSMTLPLGVAATVTHIEAVQASQRAAQAREAQRLDKAVSVSRWQAEALEQASVERDAAKAKTLELQQALDATTAERDKLKDQVAALQAVSYGLGSGPAAQTVRATVGPVANHFAFGYCTYWVASKRWIPWFGNAGVWLRAAQTYGWPTGSTPRPGAIEVANLSWFGHVAWVESVNGDGTYWVSEMNYYGWNVVDRRLVIPWLERLQGFIYT